MNLVTLMDYEDPKGILMCKGWLWLARRHNPNAKIIILHHDKIAEIRSFAENRIRNVTFERLDLDKVVPREKMNGHTFYCQDLTFSRWLALERLGLDRYLFVEADAWPIYDLSEWWNVTHEKPFIAVMEDDREGPPYFNIGCFSHHHPTPFFTYKLLMEEYALNGNTIPISIGDQALMNLWAWRNNYDAFHPQIDKMWNCPTYDRMAEIKLGQCNDKEIEVFHAEKRVKILHTWGPRKWWDTPELAPITRFVEEKVS
jgi:hypothetical protein